VKPLLQTVDFSFIMQISELASDVDSLMNSIVDATQGFINDTVMDELHPDR
jgi:rRNA-processing protein FCF1